MKLANNEGQDVFPFIMLPSIPSRDILLISFCYASQKAVAVFAVVVPMLCGRFFCARAEWINFPTAAELIIKERGQLSSPANRARASLRS